MNITLASANRHKFKELREVFADTSVNIEAADVSMLEGVEESAPTFVENALIKARALAEKVDGPTLADDSGLVVPCLNGAPGVYSSRYCGEHASDAENNAKLVRELKMQGFSGAHDKEGAPEAFFYCVLVFLEGPRYPTPLMCEGVWRGRILLDARGDSGFGYDPHFLPNGETRSAAELSVQEKNAQSHRGQASHAMRSLLLGA